jgi:hypothetical protein
MTKLGIVVTNPNLLTITPTLPTEVGSHTIKITLTDNCGATTTNDLIVVVGNTAPYFTVASLPFE